MCKERKKTPTEETSPKKEGIRIELGGVLYEIENGIRIVRLKLIPEDKYDEDAVLEIIGKGKSVIIVIDPGHGYTTGNTGAASRIYTYKVQGEDGKPLMKDKEYVTSTGNVENLPNYVLDDPNTWIISSKEDLKRPEGFLVFDVSLKLKELLNNEGYDSVFLTRTDKGPISGADNSTTRAERIKIANDNNADYFISIHADGVAGYTATGSHVIYPSSNVADKETVEKSKELGDYILKYYDVVKVESNSPKQDVRGLQVLGNSNKTKRKVLIELGFVTSPKDAKALFENEDKIAEQIKKGLMEHINQIFYTEKQ